MSNQTVMDGEQAHVMQTYGRQPVVFVSGEGSWLTDDQGRDYLDCLTGLAVVSVGHANSRVASAVATQMGRLTHVSNLFYTAPMVELAKRLSELSGLDRTFFANCGATANEAAIKLARRFGQLHRGEDCFQVVSLTDSFHGRTLATLAATGQPAKQATFAPLPTGFAQVEAGDLSALEAAVSDTTAAVLVETVQGEGGVVPLEADYLAGVRKLCDATGALMIIDDIQAGMGRTGEWFSWQAMGIQPDIATLAKALGNGLPIGACIASEKVAAAFRPGDHASTFGGGPVVCAAALAVIAEIDERHLLENCRQRSQQLVDGLLSVPGVSSVRGRGLLLAAVLEEPRASAVAAAALSNGLVVNAVRADSIRFAPPLTISEEEVTEALVRFEASL